MSTALIAGLTIGLGIPTILGLRYLVSSKSNGQNMTDSNNGFEMIENKNVNGSEHILVGGKKSRKQRERRKKIKSIKSKK